MGFPAAKQGDHIKALDTHLIQPPTTSPPVPTPHPFDGIIDGSLSDNVNIDGKPAATINSTATNTPPHIPQGGTFVNPPSNKGKIVTGSKTVFINKLGAARVGDSALTCNDPTDLPFGTVVVEGLFGQVFIGG
jgi:uncharacterized Zn-binding protein involved in type VI secretion